MLGSALLAVAIVGCTAKTHLSGSKPNILILFADDFGWGDLHSYGHPTQEPGEIDDMAQRGVRFTQWYAAESICTPSRMGLMTGRMPTRMGMGHTVFGPSGSEALPPTDLTLADVLKPLGYATGMAGKWHLGINKAQYNDGLYLPYYRGFEHVGHILPFSNHWACDESGRHSPKPGMDATADKERNSSCFLYHNTTLVQQPIDHTNLTETLVADAQAFISKAVADQTPFLYYLAFPQCHVSMFTDFAWTNTSKNGIFGDQIRAMDWAAGQVFSLLQTLGVDSNTISFFSSDHGPHVELCLEGGTAAHLRGGKGDSSWEGGLRVPGIIAWPGTITGGRVETAVVSMMDIFATAVDLAGGTMPTNHEMDGKSLVPLLLGQNDSSPHEALFHYCGDTLMAVRYKQFKLRFFTEQLPLDNYSIEHCSHGWADGEFFQGGWGCHGGSVTTNNPPELLNIESDPAEEYPLLVTDLWQQHLASQRSTLSPTSPLWRLQYYADINALPTCDGNQTVLSHTAYEGYAGASFPAGTASGEMVDVCRNRCCNDTNCVAFVMQTHSRNTGQPEGSCTIDEPCCWLAGAEGVKPDDPTNDNITSGIVRSVGPSPGPAPVPPAGPYADVLRAIDEILAKHLSTMTRETLPGKPSDNLTPCCSDTPSDGVCTCNYPSKSPP